MKTINTLIATATLAGAVFASSAAFAVDEYNVSTGTTLTNAGIALRGDDAVALATGLDVTPGRAKFTVERDGVAYYFSSKETMKQFAADPERYMPQYGGFCAFGVAIGKFQVLQHRMVDMFMAHEQSVSMTYMVNLKLAEGDEERTKAAAGAKVQIGKAGRYVGQQAVQLHGGMGMTDELSVGHYFKRLTMIDTQFGNVDYQLKRYSQAA